MSVASKPRPMMSMHVDSDPKPSGGFEWTQAPWGRVLRCTRPARRRIFSPPRDLVLRDDACGVASGAGVTGCAARVGWLLAQTGARHPFRARPPGRAAASRPPAGRHRHQRRSIVAIGVRVADCAPVLLYDPRARRRRRRARRLARGRGPGVVGGDPGDAAGVWIAPLRHPRGDRSVPGSMLRRGGARSRRRVPRRRGRQIDPSTRGSGRAAAIDRFSIWNAPTAISSNARGSIPTTCPPPALHEDAPRSPAFVPRRSRRRRPPPRGHPGGWHVSGWHLEWLAL